MSAVDVQAAAVREELVEQPVIVWRRALLLPFHLEPAGVDQRVLVFVVPQGRPRGNPGDAVDEKDCIGHGVRIGRASHRDAELGFSADDARRHR
jgi:hypothetical protein